MVRLGVVLFFVIPRNPSFSFYEVTPFGVGNSTVSFSRIPTNFTFTGELNLYGQLCHPQDGGMTSSHPADTSASYIPIQFSSLHATLYDLNTNEAIGTGDWGSHSLSHGSMVPLVIPLTFSYTALNASDTTCK